MFSSLIHETKTNKMLFDENNASLLSYWCIYCYRLCCYKCRIPRGQEVHSSFAN